MKKLKRVLAIVCIVIIFGLYITTLIVALLGREYKALFSACIVATVVIPCMFYIISWVSKVLQERNTGENQ